MCVTQAKAARDKAMLEAQRAKLRLSIPLAGQLGPQISLWTKHLRDFVFFLQMFEIPFTAMVHLTIIIYIQGTDGGGVMYLDRVLSRAIVQ